MIDESGCSSAVLGGGSGAAAWGYAHAPVDGRYYIGDRIETHPVRNANSSLKREEPC